MSFTAFVTDNSLPETTFKSTSGMIDRSPLIEISNTNPVDVFNTIPVNPIQFLPDDLLTDQVRLLSFIVVQWGSKQLTNDKSVLNYWY